jgi:hypothetical protein
LKVTRGARKKGKKEKKTLKNKENKGAGKEDEVRFKSVLAYSVTPYRPFYLL